jgi:hypothetical protein
MISYTQSQLGACASQASRCSSIVTSKSSLSYFMGISNPVLWKLIWSYEVSFVAVFDEWYVRVRMTWFYQVFRLHQVNHMSRSKCLCACVLGRRKLTHRRVESYWKRAPTWIETLNPKPTCGVWADIIPASMNENEFITRQSNGAEANDPEI